MTRTPIRLLVLTLASALAAVVLPATAQAAPYCGITWGSTAKAHSAPDREMVNGIRAGSIRGFLLGMKLTFQREASRGLSATYHFTFTGREPAEATVVIRDRTIAVQDGHVGEAQVRITADGDAWLGVVAKERSLIWSLLRGRIRVRGSLRLLAAFGKCLPS